MKHEPKPIGELNGFWSIMFRTSLAVFPLFASSVLAFSVWIVKTIYAHDKAISQHEIMLSVPRFSQSEALAREDRVRSDFVSALRDLEDKIRNRPLRQIER